MSTEIATIEQLEQQLRVVETQHKIAALQAEVGEYEQRKEYARYLHEAAAWGERVSPTEYLNDDPTFGRYVSPISRIDDRTDGRYRPFYETEQDIAFIRGAARVMVSGFSAGQNIMANLEAFTLSTGFGYEVEPEEDGTQSLAEKAEAVLEAFFDDNDWCGDFEREVHWRSREDGEAAIVLRPRGWRTYAQFVEPDQLTQPASPRELEDWIAFKSRGLERSSSWSFGVHTTADDCSRHLGYHVVFDGAGGNWDYFPANDVPLALQLGSGVMHLIKRNVPRNCKRGVSDFQPVMSRLERMEKLSTNVELTSAIQAAIAFIRQHAGATPGQVSTFANAQKTDTYTKPLPSGGAVQQPRQKINPGAIIDVTGGTTFMYGPTGQNNAPTYIDVIQSALRLSGSRWAMPEYMISGDASNANFASTLVSGAPFVRLRETDQGFYVKQFDRLLWKVLRIAYEGGCFGRGSSWQDIEQSVKIVITPPDVTISDELKSAQVKEIEKRNGVLSATTWAKESGRDPEVEQESIARENAMGIGTQQAIGQPTAPSGNPSDQAAEIGALRGRFDAAETKEEMAAVFREARNLL